MSLAWPWSGMSLPQEETVGVLGPWTGAQYGWDPSSPTTNYLTTLKSDRLTFFHMTVWLANCSWLTAYLTKCQLEPPPGRDILWPSFVTTLARLTCGHMSALDRHLVVKCVTTLVRCTPRQRHLVVKCDTTSGQVDIWSELWVRLPFD